MRRPESKTSCQSFVLGVWLLFFAGCACGPDRWAELVETHVHCGMSPQEIEKLSGRRVTKLDYPSPRGTHVIGEEGEATEVWLVFKEDKLQEVQLGWMYRMKRMAYAQSVRLCRTSSEPSLSIRPQSQKLPLQRWNWFLAADTEGKWITTKGYAEATFQRNHFVAALRFGPDSDVYYEVSGSIDSQDAIEVLVTSPGQTHLLLSSAENFLREPRLMVSKQ